MRYRRKSIGTNLYVLSFHDTRNIIIKIPTKQYNFYIIIKTVSFIPFMRIIENIAQMVPMYLSVGNGSQIISYDKRLP